MVYLLASSLQPAEANAGVNTVYHILNNVDIPKGAVRETDGSNDYTQWSVIKDTKHLKLHIKTYDNLNYVTVDLPTLVAATTEIKPMSLNTLTHTPVSDVTQFFIKGS